LPQSVLCIKKIYAPGDSRANMDYDVDELDTILSSGVLFWWNLSVWPLDKNSPLCSLSLLRCWQAFLIPAAFDTWGHQQSSARIVFTDKACSLP